MLMLPSFDVLLSGSCLPFHPPNSPFFGSSTYLSDNSPPATLPYVNSLIPLAWQYCNMPFRGRLSSSENCTYMSQANNKQRRVTTWQVRGQRSHAVAAQAAQMHAGRLTEHDVASRLLTWLFATGTPASTICLTASTFMLVKPTCSRQQKYR